MMHVTRTEIANALTAMGSTLTAAASDYLFTQLGGEAHHNQVEACEETMTDAFEAWAKAKHCPDYNSAKAARIALNHIGVAQGYSMNDLPYVGD